MPTGYYVRAQKQSYPYATMLLIGPYASGLPAMMMVGPVRNAMRDQNVEISTVSLTKKHLPVGKMDLTLLKPEDVIEASRKR